MPDKDSRLDTLDEASNALTSDGEDGNHPLHARLRPPVHLAPEAVRGAVSRGAIANAGEQCPTCTASIRGRFCSQCGEKAPSSRPWSVRAFLRKSFTSILEADNRFLRSLGLLTWRPGLLTNAYLSGKRKPLIKPVQLFAIVNVLFVILASNIGPDTFRTPLRYHVTSTNFYHQELAARWVNTAINAPDNWSYESGSQSQLARDRSIPDSTKGSSPVPAPDFDVASAEAMDRFESYASRFNGNATRLSESLIFVFIPFIALWLWGLRSLFGSDTFRQQSQTCGMPRSRGMLPDWVHATHVMAGMLGVMFVTSLILVAVQGVLFLANISPDSVRLGPLEPPEVVVTTLSITYLYQSFRRRWEISSPAALVAGIATIFVFYELLLLYRALLFGLGFLLT